MKSSIQLSTLTVLIQRDLRDLLTVPWKEISILKKELGTLKTQLSKLASMETNANFIQMVNVAAQLRNKMIRFVKRMLSTRAARDEYMPTLQSERRFVDLTNRIQSHYPTLTVFDLARSINAVTKQSAIKAHDETSMSMEDIEDVLSKHVSSNDRHSISENHRERLSRTSRHGSWVTVTKMSEFFFWSFMRTLRNKKNQTFLSRCDFFDRNETCNRDNYQSHCH